MPLLHLVLLPPPNFSSHDCRICLKLKGVLVLCFHSGFMEPFHEFYGIIALLCVTNDAVSAVLRFY